MKNQRKRRGISEVGPARLNGQPSLAGARFGDRVAFMG